MIKQQRITIPLVSKWIFLLGTLFVPLHLVNSCKPTNTKPPPPTLCKFYQSFRTPDQYQNGGIPFLRHVSIWEVSGNAANTLSATLSTCEHACLIREGFPCVGFDVAKDPVERLRELDLFLKNVEYVAYEYLRPETRNPFQAKVKDLLDTLQDLVKWGCVSGQCGSDNKCTAGERTGPPWNYMDKIKPIYTEEALAQLREIEDAADKARLMAMSTKAPLNVTERPKRNSADRCQLVSYSTFLSVLGFNSLKYNGNIF